MESRTKAGVMPASQLLRVELPVRGGARMDREAARVADFGKVIKQFQAVDEGEGRRLAPDQLIAVALSGKLNEAEASRAFAAPHP